MSRKLNPKSMYWSVWRAVYEAVYLAESLTVDRAVLDAVRLAVGDAADEAVYNAVQQAVAMWRAIRNQPPHPNLQRFIAEVQQARGSAA